jgi:hypothetical protein
MPALFDGGAPIGVAGAVRQPRFHRQRESDVRPNAADWLREALTASSVESMRLKSAAADAGIGPKSLRNARDRLGVVATRHGHGVSMRSVWSLPGSMARADSTGPSLAAPANSAPALASIRAPACALDPSPLPAPGMCAFVVAEMVALSPAERARVERRVQEFARRGLDTARARDVAVRLVMERDRVSSASGSCIECQCFQDNSCEPGQKGFTPGPRDPSEVWMCWTSRRS